MKRIIITGLVLLALGATWGIAQESKKEGHSGMQDMMKSKSSEDSHGMMQGMQGMMGTMMKMMEQCSMMMQPSHGPVEPKESPKK
jgi:hypothetical protein